MAALFDPSDHVIRVIGDPVRRAGLLIEITMSTRGLHEALVTYASQVLWVSTAISALTAVLLFWARAAGLAPADAPCGFAYEILRQRTGRCPKHHRP